MTLKTAQVLTAYNHVEPSILPRRNDLRLLIGQAQFRTIDFELNRDGLANIISNLECFGWTWFYKDTPKLNQSRTCIDLLQLFRTQFLTHHPVLPVVFRQRRESFPHLNIRIWFEIHMLAVVARLGFQGFVFAYWLGDKELIFNIWKKQFRLSYFTMHHPNFKLSVNWWLADLLIVLLHLLL